MIPELREKYNKEFNPETFMAFQEELNTAYQPLPFRIAETPVFVSKKFAEKMIDVCENIVNIIVQNNFKKLTEKAIPEKLFVHNENDFPHFIAFDFGVCENEKGEIEPQLIEMQGFPSLFAYEVFLEDVFKRNYPSYNNLSGYLGGFTKQSYIDVLRQIILKDCNPENVVLLEIFPEKQKTNIDFFCTREYLGIKSVCITKLVKKGRQLYYIDNGNEILIKRIYNRVIFDELLQQTPEVQEKGKVLFEDIDVQWIPHPHWFYRISKFTLPLIDHPHIPKTYYLDQLNHLPPDLENYVLKPLFSFAGQGVIIDVTKEDIDKIANPENWILQRKVKYAAIIKTPDEPAKVEIRIFYFWKDGEIRPIPTNNLARLSKGKMIGVRYNKDKTWTGGSFCLFED
jgi:glutathionylspermidine synthase